MAKYAGPDTIAGIVASSPLRPRFSVRRMARLLGVSTSGYYAHVTRAAATVLTPRQQRRADLEVKITEVHQDSRGTYGSPRITAELRDHGEVITAKTVARIMAAIGIEGISPRTFKERTTVVDQAASFPPDLVDRHFDQGRVDAVWLTDVTYLRCGEGEMFLVCDPGRAFPESAGLQHLRPHQRRDGQPRHRRRGGCPGWWVS
ncbi:IS3 family transposase [Amycolatopsis sp. CA-128772]|uniref:IS3 family transposase n=1 Tax=Amycolatopsis sp. CA-128772 TaxID=2073159 RepID=UPI000CCFD93D|nr:IS3 family transposase [Amycolatopsis sp. CA-128772]